MGMGFYIYEFTYRKVRYCVDATRDDGSHGRLINHSRKRPNCKPEVYVDDDLIPHIVMIALRDIDKGEELLYDYGEDDRVNLKNNPWLLTS